MNSDNDALWAAVARRDRSFDGTFVYGVLTTGVYCRPGCPSRLPLKQNVRFFARPSEAEEAGLRPCRRCRPLAASSADPDAERIRKACEFLAQNLTESLDLARIAAQAGMSRFHFLRKFKSVVGLTPRQFVEARRMDLLKGELRKRPVTDAVYEAGFGSGSRVYERANARLGMTPAEYGRGGANVSITWVSVDCELGRMLIAATDRGLCSVAFGDTEEELVKRLEAEYPAARIEPMKRPYPAEFCRWMEALRNHLRGIETHLDLPLDLRASAFQMKVWRYLQTIPYGSRCSYGEVAAGLGAPSSVRAVARACAANRVALVIPCHRVIRGGGEPGGYRWGIERKRRLLTQEESVSAQGPRPSGSAPSTASPRTA